MNFVGLQEALRKELRRRIASGELTGMELARRTGFTQAHISNFLNRKRGLKLAALDRTLRTVSLSIYDLLNPRELSQFAAVPASAQGAEVAVPTVTPEVAASSEIVIREQILAMVPYRRSLLNRIRPDAITTSRKSRTRFVVLEASAREATLMSPRMALGALLLVDRHYATLQPYRRNERNLYAVKKEQGCVLRYVEVAKESAILRPQDPDSPIEIVPIPEGRTATDLLIGRIAHISTEI